MAEGKEQRRVCKQDNVRWFFFPGTDGGQAELSMLWSGRNLSASKFYTRTEE